jgi:hypothetical protein
MKKGILILCAVLFVATGTLAGPAQYQVTGPVLEVRDDAIVVGQREVRLLMTRLPVAGISLGSGNGFYTMHAAD